MDLLYKYFSNESKYAFQNLENSHICFSSLETLNDPFEGVGSYLYQVSDDEKAYWESIGSDAPMLLSKRFSDDIRDVVNFKYRVFCSTKENNNPLMWAYYANSHKGFCVGYAREDILKLSDTAKDIVYRDEMYSINPDENTFKELLFQKATDWQREKEHRAIYQLKNEDVEYLPADAFFTENPDSRKIYLLQGHAQMNNLRTLCSDKFIIKTCTPAVIYIGLRTPMDTRKKLMEIARSKNIQVFQMIQEQNRYSFTHEQLF